MIKQRQKMEKTMRIMKVMVLSLLLTAGNICVAFAAPPDYAGNAKTWLSSQLGSIALITLILVLVGCLIKKSYTGAIVTVLAGGAVTYLIFNPDKIKTIGTAIGSVLGF